MARRWRGHLFGGGYFIGGNFFSAGKAGRNGGDAHPRKREDEEEVEQRGGRRSFFVLDAKRASHVGIQGGGGRSRPIAKPIYEVGVDTSTHDFM